MLIITAVSLISWAIVVTLLFVGVVFRSEGAMAAGALFFIANIVIHCSFQAGANWQVDDCLSKYNLVPKISTPPRHHE